MPVEPVGTLKPMLRVGVPTLVLLSPLEVCLRLLYGLVLDTVMGNLIWDAQILYLQYQYSGNMTLLEKVVYPILRMGTNYYLHVIEKGEDGKYHTPYAMSPEYAADTDTNWDIANFKWGCKTLIHIAKDILKIDDPYIPKWEDAYNNMVDYPVDDDGLLIGMSCVCLIIE